MSATFDCIFSAGSIGNWIACALKFDLKEGNTVDNLCHQSIVFNSSNELECLIQRYDNYLCDKQRYCNRVLDFSSVNNFVYVHRMTKIVVISSFVNEQSAFKCPFCSMLVFVCWL